MAMIGLRTTVRQFEREFRANIRFSKANRGVLFKKIGGKSYVAMSGPYSKSEATQIADKMRRAEFGIRLFKDRAGYWIFASTVGYMHL